MSQLIYKLCIKPKRGAKKRLLISASKTLSDLDSKIRNAMGYDSWDHLSGFYEGTPFHSNEIATISPDGCGDNSKTALEHLNLQSGDEFGYVYDFGDCVESMIFVDEIS